MKKIALLFSMLFVLAFANRVKAQAYDKAIGLRFGYPLAASFKFFVTEPGAIEIYLGIRSWTWYSSINPGAMYQHHFPISGVDGLSWYVGGGAGLELNNYKTGYDGDNLGIYINGVLGLDYRFANAPINLSVDWSPTFVLSGGNAYVNDFRGGYGALSARYILGE